MKKIKKVTFTVLAACMLLMGSMTAFAAGPSLHTTEDPVDNEYFSINDGYQNKDYLVKGYTVIKRSPSSTSESVASFGSG